MKLSRGIIKESLHEESTKRENVNPNVLYERRTVPGDDMGNAKTGSFLDFLIRGQVETHTSVDR